MTNDDDRDRTHWATCWRDGGRRHWQCAVAEAESDLRMAPRQRKRGAAVNTRAWQTQWNNVTSIVLAATAGQAKAATFQGAKDAGYVPDWNGIRCQRARRYDVLLLSTTKSRQLLTLEAADQIKAQYR